MRNAHPNVAALLAGTVWAVEPEKLRQIGALVETFGPDGVRAEEGEGPKQWNDYHAEPVTVENGIATVPVDGVMMRRANMMMSYSGGTSTDILARTLRTLGADDSVKGIVLRINSPGGTVDGIDAVTRAVKYAAAEKPVYALADSAALSGGMWLGVSATKFFATPDALVGSIGVIATRYDFSGAMAAAGVREHIFRAGTYKALGQQSEPLTENEVTEEQRILDNYYQLFVNHVAESRGITPEAVVETQARVYGANEAVALNLIDSVKTYEDVIAGMTGDIEAADRVKALEGEMETGFGERDTRFAAEQSARIEAEAKYAALEAQHATTVSDARASKISAAVTQLVETDQKVLAGPDAVAALTARLEADFEGTMATMAFVPVGAAAPKNAPQIDGTAGSAPTSKEAMVADAEKRGIPVAETAGGAKVYAASTMEFLDLSGDTPAFKNVKTAAPAGN